MGYIAIFGAPLLFLRVFLFVVHMASIIKMLSLVPGLAVVILCTASDAVVKHMPPDAAASLESQAPQVVQAPQDCSYGKRCNTDADCDIDSKGGCKCKKGSIWFPALVCSAIPSED